MSLPFAPDEEFVIKEPLMTVATPASVALMFVVALVGFGWYIPAAIVLAGAAAYTYIRFCAETRVTVSETGVRIRSTGRGDETIKVADISHMEIEEPELQPLSVLCIQTYGGGVTKVAFRSKHDAEDCMKLIVRRQNQM